MRVLVGRSRERWYAGLEVERVCFLEMTRGEIYLVEDVEGYNGNKTGYPRVLEQLELVCEL